MILKLNSFNAIKNTTTEVAVQSDILKLSCAHFGLQQLGLMSAART